ncbi:MAG: pyridoxal-dependent decarboxylase [Bacteroidota bacterium]
MKNENKIQASMFKEVRDKRAIEKAHLYGQQYLDRAFERNVYPTTEALEDLKHFEEDLPSRPTEASAVIEFLNTHGSLATTAQIGGRYFGFVNGGVVPAALAAKMLATFWDQNAAMHVMSPVSSKLETIVERWLQQVLGLPDRMVAGLVGGSTAANFCGLAAGRYRLLKRQNWDVNEKGLFDAPKLRIVLGRDAHASVLKVLGLLGFGRENFEWVDVDEQGRIIPELIPALDSRSILILQAGHVNSGAFDLFNEICSKAKSANAWIHVDGAFGLWAAAVKQLRHLTQGIEDANSLAVDCHKTLNTPYDSGIVLCNDEDAIISVMQSSGSYFVLGGGRDNMMYGLDMSQRARAVEVWAALKSLGKEGVNEMVYGLHERALQFANEIQGIPGFEVLNDVVFNQVLVRCESDELSIKTTERIQELRECWVGGSIWHGRKVIRVCVCSWATTESDITRSVTSFQQALHDVKKR